MCGPTKNDPTMMIIEPKNDETAHGNFHGSDEMEVSELRSTDVLLGRGNGAAAHPGNKRFREIVRANKKVYLAAPRHCKTSVAKEVIGQIESLDPPGRFLERVEEGRYLIVSPTKALEKTSQALREKPSRTSTFSTSTWSPMPSDDSILSVSSHEDIVSLTYERLEKRLMMDEVVSYSVPPFIPYGVQLPFVQSFAPPKVGMSDFAALESNHFLSPQALQPPLQYPTIANANEQFQLETSVSAPPAWTVDNTMTGFARGDSMAPAYGQFDDADEPNYDTSLSMFQSYARNVYVG